MTVRDTCSEAKSFYCQLDDENCIHLKKNITTIIKYREQWVYLEHDGVILLFRLLKSVSSKGYHMMKSFGNLRNKTS